MNPHNLFGGRDSHLDPRLNRLYPWLEKAKANKTMSKKLLKALARVKLIS